MEREQEIYINKSSKGEEYNAYGLKKSDKKPVRHQSQVRRQEISIDKLLRGDIIGYEDEENKLLFNRLVEGTDVTAHKLIQIYEDAKAGKKQTRLADAVVENKLPERNYSRYAEGIFLESGAVTALIGEIALYMSGAPIPSGYIGALALGVGVVFAGGIEIGNLGVNAAEKLRTFIGMNKLAVEKI